MNSCCRAPVAVLAREMRELLSPGITCVLSGQSHSVSYRGRPRSGTGRWPTTHPVLRAKKDVDSMPATDCMLAHRPALADDALRGVLVHTKSPAIVR